jgi:hypothetical protein
MADYMRHHGYEIPKGTSKAAKRVLRWLSCCGTVMFEYDDGPSLLVAIELSGIAGDIGLECFKEPYRITLIDRDLVRIIRGQDD